MEIGFMLVLAVVAALAAAGGWWLGGRSGSVRAEAAERQAEDLRRQTATLQQESASLRAQVTALTAEAARREEQWKAAEAARINERELLTEARKTLTETFKSLAGDVMKENSQQFLGIAAREFSAKEQSIQTLLTPVRETLGKMEVQTRQLETQRAAAYSEVLAEIRNIQKTHETLRQETTQLVQALRAPKARGNWGELQLKRCIEFAGMIERCDFEVEKFLRGGEAEANQRPDCVVHLPNGRSIIIDAKTPLDAYLSAMACTDELQRTACLKAHATQVRTHLTQLGGKQYWQRFTDSPDFVVCFLPSEVLFSAALEQDPSLIEVGSQQNVILATPTTLIALLKAVAFGWQQVEITRNAIAIREAASELYKKLAGTQEYFLKMGNALNSAVKHFNGLVGAVEGRGSVFSLAAKLHDLGIAQAEIPEIAQLETSVRALQSSHWDGPVALAASEQSEE
jgi:DNA recombination protein RmuC